MSLLTERQKSDLNAAILEYLVSNAPQFSETAETFRIEAEVADEITVGTFLLEKKWTAVVKLQKRIMELEAKLDNYAKQGIVMPTGLRSSAAAGEVVSDVRALPRGPPKFSMTGHRGAVLVVACHPAYSLCASGGEDSSIMIWDFEAGRLEKTLKAHLGAVTGLAFSRTGHLMASCSNDLTAKIFDVNTFNCIKTLKDHDHTVSSVTFMPFTDQVVTCSRDMTVKLWEVNTGFCTRTFSGHSDWVRAVVVSVDGTYLASGGVDQSIIIWQISTGNIVRVSSCKCTIVHIFDNVLFMNL
jgi:platelet-activating factor acetylhydrolase IB subunit alpha